MIESPGCFPNISVWNNMMLQATNLGIKNPEKEIARVLKTVRMEGAASNKFRNCFMAYSEDIPLHYDRIHVANGTWYLDGRFIGDKEYCRNRLTVDYNPDAGVPDVWLKFLSELLIFAELLHDADDKVRMEAPEIFRVPGKRRPGFVRPYLEQLRHISETDENRVVRLHCFGAIKATEVGKTAIRLGIAKDNPQANHFWKKNSFTVIKEVERDGWTILVAEKKL